ncbi:unnamed protein product [Clonostachys solani]|uniref:Uncharacterized protein n=1 Tax=Clonostachys solani TaxID=160281 RepID=A0A9N9W1V4_9HYPO|nr:unnamed protein product [Clonostachys solani]
MPPYPIELQKWWMSSGYDFLTKLFEIDHLNCKQRDVGFAQTVQRRLRGFDNDQNIHEQLQGAILDIRKSLHIRYDSNRRKKLKEAAHYVFRRPDDGGLVQEHALEGLGYLDAMEIHGLTLFTAAKLSAEFGACEPGLFELAEELHQAASKRYGQFHMGFRARILLDELETDNSGVARPVQIMALLNSLFPAMVFLEDAEDSDPSPCTPGLRDSIRFSIYEHLMGENPFSITEKKALETRLLGWCDIPSYAQSHEALVRYIEESKKREEVCLGILDAAERQPRPIYVIQSPDSSITSLTISERSTTEMADSPITPTPTANAGCRDGPSRPCGSPITIASTLSVSKYLLESRSGREILPSQTDLAAFANEDWEGTPSEILEPLSAEEFDQHPITKDIDIKVSEMANLGLLLPKRLETRTS